MTQQFNDVTLPKHGEHNVVSWGGIVCSISNRRSDQRRGRSCVSYGTAAFNQIAELHAARSLSDFPTFRPETPSETIGSESPRPRR